MAPLPERSVVNRVCQHNDLDIYKTEAVVAVNTSENEAVGESSDGTAESVVNGPRQHSVSAEKNLDGNSDPHVWHQPRASPVRCCVCSFQRV